MKNKLLYYYNMYVTNIVTKDNNYYFTYKNRNYALIVYNRTIDDLPYLYELNREMINNNYKIHRVLPTIRNEIAISFNDKIYVLLKTINLDDRLININDIINFNYLPNDKIVAKLNKSNWGVLWENKIDYFEYQFNQMDKKYPIIRESFNYYVGLWENAVSYFNNINLNNKNYLTINHRRIDCNCKLTDFYNPLDLVVDYKERDVADYFKSLFFKNNNLIIGDLLDRISINRINGGLLISRMLFPSYYFDCYEKIINNELEENCLKEFIRKSDNYNRIINEMFKYYEKENLIPINWIKKKN